MVLKLWISNNEKIGITLLGNKTQPLVKANHLIRAIERNLVAIQGFTQIYKTLNNQTAQGFSTVIITDNNFLDNSSL